MKNILRIPVLVLILLAVTAPLVVADDKLESLDDRISYGIGVNVGASIQHDFQNQDIKINPELLARGIMDVMTGGSPLMTEDELKQTFEEVKAIMTEKQKKLQAEMEAKRKVEGAANQKAGEEFLAANAKKEGVKTTASGLQYKVIEPGTGKIPTATDKVKVNYRGSLVDGTEFDSSYKHGEPVVFPVGGVIKGWTEALQLMKEGGKYQLVIPADLAYQDQGNGPKIGPNSTLIFDVELLAVNPE